MLPCQQRGITCMGMQLPLRKPQTLNACTSEDSGALFPTANSPLVDCSPGGWGPLNQPFWATSLAIYGYSDNRTRIEDAAVGFVVKNKIKIKLVQLRKAHPVGIFTRTV